MPNWGEILAEVHADENRLPNGTPNFDKVRREYLRRVSEVTGRDTFLYASDFLGPKGNSDELLITLGDVEGFMEVVSGTHSGELDLILHSPGGYAEAAESIMEYLRSRYSHIRVIVPLAAMSAATMMALGADEIVMASHSQLGPIDPQITISTPEGPRGGPAKAILDEFERAKADLPDAGAMAAWLPILRGYGPGLLAQCEDTRELSESIVENWLARYMFANSGDGVGKARAAAKWFADYDNFGSHSRGIRRQSIEESGLDLRVTMLENDPSLQDAVLSVYHATTVTFRGTLARKLIENQNGQTYVLMGQPVVQFTPAQPGGVPTPPTS